MPLDLTEKLNVQVMVPQQYTGLPTVEERKEIEQAQLKNRRFLSIPRRYRVYMYVFGVL